MSAPRTIAAAFADLDGLASALKLLRAADLTDFSVYSPVGLEEYKHRLPRRGSRIRWFALAAGFVGCFLGFWLCVGSARLYSLIVGGKPVVSWLPYCVVGFEVTILTAALVTLGAVLYHARLFPRPLPPDYDPAFSEDVFGVSVRCRDQDRDSVARLLKSAGASQVREL